MAGCFIDGTREEFCRNSAEASRLKLVSMVVILVSSAAGILLPVVLARLFARNPAYANSLIVIKCFAAGVILSTSLVHVLPDAFDALADCQVVTRHPWRDFPFSGFASLIGALLALLVDVTASSHVTPDASNYVRIGLEEMGKGDVKQILPHSIAAGEVAVIACHGNGHEDEDAIHVGVDGLDEEERLMKLKQRMVSQVLEIGIIFHSVIIGMTMGMSQNHCTIRPLVAALAFHQLFEGMGLGGCIAQAGFGGTTVGYMCLIFSVTTPAGILLGMLVFHMTGYDDGSPNALIMEGLLGSLSAGILLYMALVDLIAADFFHSKTMASNPWLKKVSFILLVIGSASMSILALWA